MADNIITTIGIAAKADTKKAQEDLKDLSAELSRLKMVAKEGLEVGNFAKSMKEISDMFSNFNTDAMRRVSETITAMNSVRTVTISKTLPERMSALAKSVKDFDVPQLYQIVTGLRELKKIGGFSISSKGLTGLQKLSISFSPAPAAPVLEDIDKGAEKAEESLEDMNKEAEKSPSIWKRLGESVSQSTGKIGQFWSSIKRIAMYRAIRSALKAITQGFREGIQNMYQYSLFINGRFKESMDTLSTSSLYLKNSLGALAAPLINAVTPAIERVIDGFVDFTNVIAELIAMLSGQDTWSRALKYPKAYAEQMESASGAAKELRATLLGFDEINRLDDNNRGSRGRVGDLMDYSKMFEEVETKNFWDSFMERGKSKFTLFAGSLAGILALKLSGAFEGVVTGTSATTLLGKFGAVVLASYGGFRIGNWLYENNVFHIRDVADDLMDAGLGDAITKSFDTVRGLWDNYVNWWTDNVDLSLGWDLLYDDAVAWGDKITGFFGSVKEGYGIMHDWMIEWGYALMDFHDVRINFHTSVDSTAWDEFQRKVSGDLDRMKDQINSAHQEAIKFNPTGTITVKGTSAPYSSPNNDIYEKVDTKTINITSAVTNAAASTLKKLANMENLIDPHVKKQLGLAADGGSFSTGQVFLARESGPEIVAQIGHKTQVANNDQIVSAIETATANGNAESNVLLRQVVDTLGQILRKDNTVVANITTDSITSGLDRQNRRNGRTTVPVGV